MYHGARVVVDGETGKRSQYEEGREKRGLSNTHTDARGEGGEGGEGEGEGEVERERWERWERERWEGRKVRRSVARRGAGERNGVGSGRLERNTRSTHSLVKQTHKTRPH